jgi:hypothetical protein
MFDRVPDEHATRRDGEAIAQGVERDRKGPSESWRSVGLALVLLEPTGDPSLPSPGPPVRPVLREVEIDRQMIRLGVASNHLMDL